MDKFKVKGDYLFFKELHADTLGQNHRGSGIKDRRPTGHKLITELHPVFFQDKNVWNRVKILLEGVRKSNIPHLYSPDKIIEQDNGVLLIYPYFKGKTFEQIMEDAVKTDNPINFDLALSIGMSIAEQIDVGSSIVVSGKKSFHGFLTPDNILIDYDGNIMLKNYGICPYIDQNDAIFAELEQRYGAWLTPEFVRRDKIVSQSDIYHLGYIIFRMLTGKYFSYTEGEDFDAKFSNISFSQHIPSTDKDFLTHIINFFKKTLNPDPMKRFTYIRELKDYVTNYFHIEELSSITFNLAYFMNSLYKDAMEEEEAEMSGELAYEIPEEKPEPVAPSATGKKDSEIVESILTGLEEQEKTKSKALIPIIVGSALVVIIGVVSFLFISQSSKKAEKARMAALQEQRRLEERLQQTEQEFQKKLREIETQTITTEEDRVKREQKLQELEQWKSEQDRIAREKVKKAEEERKKQEAEQLRLQQEAEEAKKAEEARKQKEEEERLQREEEERKAREEAAKIPNVGDLVPLTEVTKKPVKISGKDPRFSPAVRKKFKDKTMTVLSSVLVDENGKVSKVKVLGEVPPEIKMDIVATIADWEYSPAEKNKIRVKVWIQVSMRIEF